MQLNTFARKHHSIAVQKSLIIQLKPSHSAANIEHRHDCCTWQWPLPDFVYHLVPSGSWLVARIWKQCPSRSLSICLLSPPSGIISRRVGKAKISPVHARSIQDSLGRKDRTWREPCKILFQEITSISSIWERKRCKEQDQVRGREGGLKSKDLPQTWMEQITLDRSMAATWGRKSKRMITLDPDHFGFQRAGRPEEGP